MLTEREAVQKIRDYACMFNCSVKNKEWGKAHNIYNQARDAAVFLQLPPDIMDEFFGSENRKGLFSREAVDRVNRECCIRRNMAYEDMECRRRGMPVRYYSEETYCAVCAKR